MGKTLTERVTIVETAFDIVVKDIQGDLKELKVDVGKMALQFPELLRRVGEHHDFMKESKSAGCPRPKNNPGINSNREHKERKLDQKKYKYIIWGYAITGAAGVISTILLLVFK